MKIAVDVCVGRRGVNILRAAGHDVLEAQHGESDRSWFHRAMAWGAKLVVSADADIEILAYDNRVPFHRAPQHTDGRHVAWGVLAAVGAVAMAATAPAAHGRAKTEECLWCGASEAHGVELRGRVRVGNHEKFECVDADACKQRVERRIALAGVPR